ncbi:sensor histidine kinase [Microbacterium sp. P07]|uniref:sensor histidine kinase n=1 Tax=Microbacterium sp. P07 TaxID=3366952 RepID=UPI0037455857
MKAVRTPAWGSVATRLALTAGILASVLLASGALLVRSALHSTQMAATEQLAGAQASQIIDATRQNVRLSGEFGSLPYELLRSDGALISSSPVLADAEIDGPIMSPPREDAEQTGGEVWTGTITAGPLSGQTLTAVSSTLNASSLLDRADPPGGPLADPNLATYRAYVFVTAAAADRAVATIDPFLWSGVIVAVALLAGTAAITAKRSLRPVDQMRRAADAMSGAPDGARIAVPDSPDELRALAATLNAMLVRVDEAAIRQTRFTADAAHELRSPITSLIAALEIAQAHPGLVPAEQTLAHVHREARRLEDLAHDLLELAAAGRSEKPPQGTCADARAVLRDALAEVEERSPGVDIRVSDPAPTGGIPVRLSARDLRRVLVNLLQNATRHARTHVEIDLRVDGAVVRIEVANDGSPIPIGDKARIFEPFVRLDESRSRDTGGAGLGLAIVREIAAREGGALAVTSTPTRTAFTVTLPR